MKNFLAAVVKATTTHHYLVVANLKAGQLFLAVYFDLIPGDIVDLAGAFIDKMMMPVRVRIEKHRVRSEMQLPEQPFFYKKIERVVDSCPGDRREILLNTSPYFVGRGMLRRVEHVLGDSDALRSRLDAVLLENVSDVRFQIDNVNN